MWIDHRLQRAEEISVWALEAKNRALRGQFLTATTIVRRYVHKEKWWMSKMNLCMM